ncbi:hypothetical protein Ancab_023961 [Ancistrocladus abbreviatus]
MEVGESSGSKPSDEVWAKLVPLDSGYPDIEIRSNVTLVCSGITSTSSDKHEWCQITRNSDLCSAIIKNKSSNVILVDGVAILKGNAVGIKCGSEIIPGSAREGYLSYKFEVMPVQEESCSKKLKIFLDVEHTKCSICLNVWHDVVTVAPCLHNFCNGCFSEWLRRCQQKDSSVLCPHCRAVVQFVGKNHFLHNIEEDILQADSSLRRSEEEVALLDSYASIKSNLIISKRGNRKRRRSPIFIESEHGESEDSFYDESDEAEYPCPQCGTEFGGFRCNANTIHLQCQACGGMMPSRTDISTAQHCLGCDRAFCGAYWHAQGVSGSDLHPVCSQDTFRPISQHTLSRIPSIAHERNQHEQEVTERCISQMGKTLQDVISDWVAKLDNREIDRTRMTLNHAEIITAGTRTCNDCYDKLVSFLLYWFRISLPSHVLPPEASKREDCWYGYACRTQHHSADHARKRNHVCRPTRGSRT